MKLSEYIKSTGVSGLDLAGLVGVSQPVVSAWVLGKKQVPPVRCVEIEIATSGAVTRRDLRPDDWQKIWPELAQPSAERSCAAIDPVAVQGSV